MGYPQWINSCLERMLRKQGTILNFCFSLSLCLPNVVLLCSCLLLPTSIVCIQEVNEITITLKIKCKSKFLQEQE